jgi:hypothetical protein
VPASFNSKIREGSPAVQGAIWDGKGTNFGVTQRSLVLFRLVSD